MRQSDYGQARSDSEHGRRLTSDARAAENARWAEEWAAFETRWAAHLGSESAAWGAARAFEWFRNAEEKTEVRITGVA
jgi:hypothetical protein